MMGQLTCNPRQSPVETFRSSRIGAAVDFPFLRTRASFSSSACINALYTLGTRTNGTRLSKSDLMERRETPMPPLFPPPAPVLDGGDLGLRPSTAEAVLVGAGPGLLGTSNAKKVPSGSDTAKKEGKKARRQKFAFQTRSYVDVLDDGYRWRKYGQKAVKNSKFPRSYYRCTHEGCVVKKQVQRLSRDEEVVVTTYEGVHTHPVDRPIDDFDHILRQMRIYPSLC